MNSITKRQFLPFDTVKELLQEAKKMGTKEIYYSGGGEPFTHPNIMEVLKYSKKLGFTCYVNTNFTLLDKKKIDEIIEIGVDHFTVSIWSGTAETYSKTHPNKDEFTFCQIEENLKYLNRRKNTTPYIKLYNVIFNMNYHEINEMIKFAQRTGCESVEFTLIDTIPDKTDKLALNHFQRKELYNICKEIRREISPDFKYHGVYLFRFDQFLRRISDEEDVLTARYDRNIIDSIPCYIGWLFARILPDGDVNSCLKSHRFPVGNIFQNSFFEIWNSPKQRYFRRKTLVYSKNDPFFKLIGNDPKTEETGCYKSCDDIGRNLHMHKKIMSLTKLEIFILKIIEKYMKKKRIKLEKNGKLVSIYKNQLANSVEDKRILGVINGRKAFIGPEHVVIDVTNRCQDRCIACWLYSPLLNEKGPSSEWLQKQLSYSLLKRLIGELKELNVGIIRFTGGGEPLLHPNIMNIIEEVKSKGFKCTLTTSFNNIDEREIKELTKFNIDELAVSIWAGDEETYLLTHPNRRKEHFLKIKENLKLFNSLKKNTKVTLANVILNLNYSSIEEMANFAISVGADAVYFTLVDVISPDMDSLLLNDKQYQYLEENFINVVSKLRDEKIEVENLEGTIARIKTQDKKGNYDYSRINSIPCYVGWIFARILANGEVVPCCRGVKYKMGDLYKTSFKDIWFSKKYNEFRYRALNLPKYHPFFDNMGCYKECDNFMHNEEMYERVINCKF
jgi:MoaA/NifB/PqqE/SkfB family radical SAM enzyme